MQVAFVSIHISIQPNGKDQGIGFGSIIDRNELQGYIPQLKERGFAHPLLACDFTGVDPALVGWKDNNNGANNDGNPSAATATHNFQSHSLVEDARRIMVAGNNNIGETSAVFQETAAAAFARVRQWS